MLDHVLAPTRDALQRFVGIICTPRAGDSECFAGLTAGHFR